MIVPMVKAFAVCRHEDRDAMLRRLRHLGVLHIVPVRPHEGPVGEERLEALRQVEAALQVLRAFEPRGPRPPLRARDAAEEVAGIGRQGEQARQRLDTLFREADGLHRWGSVRLAQLEALRDAGLSLRVLIVPERSVGALRGRFVQPLRKLSRGRQAVGVVDVDADTIPERAEEVPPPERDRDSIEAEAAALHWALDAQRERLAALAWLIPDLERERERLEKEQRWEQVTRSGLDEDRLFAVQGWLPEERVDALSEALASGHPPVALRVEAPRADERPPTLVRYRRWARPVDGMFRILSMVPGYDEMDASALFMVALPLFAGMIIGDAGYGVLFILTALFGGRRLREALGRDMRIMVGLFGVAGLVWGALTGVWFGFTPTAMMDAGGTVAVLGRGLHALQAIRGTEAETRMLLIKICFFIGATHLVSAHLRRLLEVAPDPTALAEAGWSIVLVSMLAVIWLLFFGQEGVPPLVMRAAIVGLVTGMVLVAGFSRPDQPFAARIGLGVAGSLLPFLGTFSDTLSYIRLMAVGLASYYLGSTFNVLAVMLAGSASWFAGGLVLVVGHGLNIALILIAIFAHGVRLNVLEFSSNAGIHWTGYPYRPFSERLVKERP